MNKIEVYLNQDGKIKCWPNKLQKRKALMDYLGTKFEDKIYTEQEVNDKIKTWYLLDDFIMIRRYLIEFQILKRTRNGKEYQRYDR